MSKFALFITLLLALIQHTYSAVGFQQSALNAAGERPLQVTLWYPTQASTGIQTPGDNVVFYGIKAVNDAPPDAGKHPLVVLSHGYGGSWRNLSWLAAALVQQGYIVAAPDHPGTTTADRRPEEAHQLWLRPRDISRTIDYVLADKDLAERIDPTRIAAVGHSLGGWTVMALAGARFSPSQFRADCKTPISQTICHLETGLGLATKGADNAFSQSQADRRIKAVVALDPGLTRGFSSESLSAISDPVLLLAAGNNIADLPAREESGYLASHLPATTTTFRILPGATHFSFMQLCKPGAEKILEQASPGDGKVCRDGRQQNREALHTAIQRQVISFLARSLDYPIDAASGDTRADSSR
jgi:predicted dienelactone hydrolase